MRLAAAPGLLFALFVTLLSADEASANGRFPAAQHVLVGPGRDSRVIALRTTFGFIVSDDSGATFHWICENALGYDGPPFDPGYAIDPAGALHVGTFEGLNRASPDRCVYTGTPVLAGNYVIDLDHSPDSRIIVAATSSGATGARNGVFRSDDGGASFHQMGMGVLGVLFETLEMAPTDPQRVYLTGVNMEPRRVVFYRSDDGGTTLRELPFAPPHRISAGFIAGVDPSDPDVVYVRGNLDRSVDGGVDAGGVEVTTVLVRTRNGGMTWEQIAQTAGPMLGFAISDDGRTVWYGGPDERDGLFRSSDGGGSFQRIGNQDVLCLRQHSGTLYMCANYVLNFALGRSTDRGDTFQTLIDFEDVQGPFACPAGSPETDICAARWPTVRAMFISQDAGIDFDAGRSDSGMARDAGMDVPGAVEMGRVGSCGCRMVAQTGSAPVPAWFVSSVFALALVMRRRRR